MLSMNAFGIDLGTSNIKIYNRADDTILVEKNMIAIENKNTLFAYGDSAFEMYEKAPPSIHVSFPISKGVISHFEDMVALWNFMIQGIAKRRKLWHCSFYIAVPADITEVEKQAYSKIITQSEYKPKKVCLIDKPVADAYGLGLDVEKSRGILVVNFGADTTEITILSLGGIVSSKLLPFGGNYFDKVIQNYVRRKYNFVIGLRSAEQLKMELVSAYKSDKEMSVVGRDVLKGLPGQITLNAKEIHPLVQDVFHKIAAEVRSMLEHTPPEISSEIVHNGIFLTGGSSFIEGIDQLIANEVNVKVNTTDSARKTVVTGMGYLAEHPKVAARYAVPLE